MCGWNSGSASIGAAASFIAWITSSGSSSYPTGIEIT